MITEIVDIPEIKRYISSYLNQHKDAINLYLYTPNNIASIYQGNNDRTARLNRQLYGYNGIFNAHLSVADKISRYKYQEKCKQFEQYKQLIYREQHT